MLRILPTLEFGQVIALRHQQILATLYDLRRASPRRNVQQNKSIAVMSGEKAHRASASVLAHQMLSPFPKPNGKPSVILLQNWHWKTPQLWLR